MFFRNFFVYKRADSNRDKKFSSERNELESAQEGENSRNLSSADVVEPEFETNLGESSHHLCPNHGTGTTLGARHGAVARIARGQPSGSNGPSKVQTQAFSSTGIKKPSQLRIPAQRKSITSSQQPFIPNISLFEMKRRKNTCGSAAVRRKLGELHKENPEQPFSASGALDEESLDNGRVNRDHRRDRSAWLSADVLADLVKLESSSSPTAICRPSERPLVKTMPLQRSPATSPSNRTSREPFSYSGASETNSPLIYSAVKDHSIDAVDSSGNSEESVTVGTRVSTNYAPDSTELSTQLLEESSVVGHKSDLDPRQLSVAAVSKLSAPSTDVAARSSFWSLLLAQCRCMVAPRWWTYLVSDYNRFIRIRVIVLTAYCIAHLLLLKSKFWETPEVALPAKPPSLWQLYPSLDVKPACIYDYNARRRQAPRDQMGPGQLDSGLILREEDLPTDVAAEFNINVSNYPSPIAAWDAKFNGRSEELSISDAALLHCGVLDPIERGLLTRADEFITLAHPHVDGPKHLPVSLSAAMRRGALYTAFEAAGLLWLIAPGTSPIARAIKRPRIKRNILGFIAALLLAMNWSGTVFGGLHHKTVLFPDLWGLIHGRINANYLQVHSCSSVAAQDLLLTQSQWTVWHSAQFFADWITCNPDRSEPWRANRGNLTTAEKNEPNYEEFVKMSAPVLKRSKFSWRRWHQSLYFQALKLFADVKAQGGWTYMAGFFSREFLRSSINSAREKNRALVQLFWTILFEDPRLPLFVLWSLDYLGAIFTLFACIQYFSWWVFILPTATWLFFHWHAYPHMRDIPSPDANDVHWYNFALNRGKDFLWSGPAGILEAHLRHVPVDLLFTKYIPMQSDNTLLALDVVLPQKTVVALVSRFESRKYRLFYKNVLGLPRAVVDPPGYHGGAADLRALPPPASMDALREELTLPTFIQATRYNRRMTLKWPFTLLPIWRQVPSSSTNLWAWQFPETLVKNGYAFVAVDLRGTGASFGSRPIDFAPFEVSDLREIYDWVAAQFWFDGHVGTGGFSYDGMAGLTMAGRSKIDAVLALFTPSRRNFWWKA